MTHKWLKKRWSWVTAITVGAIILFASVGPLLWPIPPLENTRPPEQLADASSQFVKVGGVTLHHKTWGFKVGAPGQKERVAIVLLHGFGASTFSWESVAPQLSKMLPVVAFDRPGFGLTERLLEWEGSNPYSPETQADLTVELMDQLGVDKAVLIGHSAGGTVAALIAARYPSRVEAIIFEDAAIYAGGPPRFLTPIFRTPQFMRIGPLLARSLGSGAGERFIKSAWYKPSAIPESTFAGYRTPLQAHDWDKALWLLTVAERAKDVPSVVSSIKVPTLFITGSNDTIVPPKDTQKAARLLKGSRLITIEDTGHIPHEERPDWFVEAVTEFLRMRGLL